MNLKAKMNAKTAYVPPKVEVTRVAVEGNFAQSSVEPVDLGMDKFMEYEWDTQNEIVNPDIKIL